MGSREHKRAALNEKLQQLRVATNSSARNKASIIVDASKYIKELKRKVKRLNKDAGTSQSSSAQTPLPAQVTVETLESGFLINVFSGKNCPGLLVSILEAFEKLGLDVHDARVSCSDVFQLEAVGGESGKVKKEQGTSRVDWTKIVNLSHTFQNNPEHLHGLDSQVVKQAVLEAIKNWSESSGQD